MESKDNVTDYQNNELDKEITELKEWQDNQYNPGHYIGTGRVPKPLSSLSKYPVIMLIFGTLGLITELLVLLAAKFTIANLPGLIVCSALSIAFIYGGVVRLKARKEGRKK